MRQSKPVSFLDTFLCVFFSAVMAIPNVVWADALTQVTIVPTPVAAAPPGTPLTFKLEVSSTTNGVSCLVQTGTSLTSTNPAVWRTLLSVQASPTNTVTIPGFQATNQASFFRALEFLAATDTNAPAWTNGLGGRYAFQQSSNLLAQWNAAADNFGVAAYRIYFGTNLFTNVLGNTFSCLLPINPRQRADIRIEAVDASDNATALLSLAYLPGDKLLAASDDSGRVYIFHFREDGTFSTACEIANFGALDRGVSLGDFDRDGILDLISGYASGQSLFPSFLKGRGDGTFATRVALPTASGANSYMMGATVGDFDCDGNLDFAVTGHDRYVFFYWGHGNGSFALETKDWGAYGIGLAAGDFNEDGRKDVVRTTYSDGYVRLFLSNGDRSFTEANRVGDAGSQPYGPVVGDFDEDGHLDIITCADGSGDITFFKGHGDGTFTNLGVNGVRSNLDLNNYGAMSAFDYNEDGHLDLVLVNYSGGSAYFFAGNGDGTFSNNRVTLATGLGNALGVASPPLPSLVDVSISPTDPVTNLNQALPFQAAGSGVTTNDLVRWMFGDQGTNPFAWTFTTNMTDTGLTIAHTYTNEGRFVARLLHTTTNSTTTNTINSARGTWVTILGQPPVANAGGPYVLGEQVATQMVWTASLDGSASSDDFGITNYFWTFGDGVSLNNGPVVNHSWTNFGAWSIGLTVSDIVGQTGSNATTVTFAPGTPPVAVIDGPTLLNETAATNGAWYARFFGTNSTDDSGRIWKYAWNFGNSTTASGAIVQAIYGTTGIYTVALTVMDHAGQTNSATQSVTVQADASPVAVITGPAVLDETFASANVWRATFSGASSTDDRGIWKYDWNFGNGTSGSGSSALGAYTATGNYTVTLTVTDHAGQTNATTFPITVQADAPPVPVITGPTLIDESSASNGVWRAAFYATNSTDDRGIWKYEWSFGNGTAGSGSAAQATFSAVGTYVVTLTVTDQAGRARAATHTVTVRANGVPTPVITGSGLLTEAVCTNGLWFGAWDGLASTDDRGIYRYEWNFGDGATASGSSVTHQYARQGIYPLSLTVYDFGNQTATLTQNVVVIPGALPVPRITASTLTPEGMEPVHFSAASSTDDYGIISYRWLFPARLFDFTGQVLDTNLWRAANVSQDDKLIVTGTANWGRSYFFAPDLRIARGTALEGRVDTSTGSSYAMVGLRDLASSPGDYNNLVYAIYFANGELHIYEAGTSPGKVGSYNKGISYDFQIESKPGSGARYFIRPSGAGQPFVKIHESSKYSNPTFTLGADVHSGVFGFDDWSATPVFYQRDIVTPVFPSGPVVLEVVDNAFQTNSTSLLIDTKNAAPPVAIAIGPTNAPAGTMLNYQGYLSSDDHGIVSYTWDFGDGSPLGSGPTVSHFYNTPGTYTNALTVRDYAGQVGTSILTVQVGAGNALVCVPWRIISGIEQPHETYASNSIRVKAVGRSLPVPFSYTWDFGDGSGIVTGLVTSAATLYNLEASHAYSGADETPYVAKIVVLLTNGTMLGDTYPVIMKPKSIKTEMNVAIDEGLWYLHKIQTPIDLGSGAGGSYWTEGGYTITPTASAVHAFGINGHLATDDALQDPYVDTVQRGINYLLTRLAASSIGARTYGIPDGNNNGIGLGASEGNAPYQTGPVMDALVAATRPELVATVGGTGVKGRPFHDIMQDLVDMYCWGQSDSGGWRYSWQQEPDNSACQWGAIGLMAAERYWGIPAPAWVKARNVVWLNNSCCYGYGGGGDGEATTPSGLVQVTFNDISTNNSLWRTAESRVAGRWSSTMSGNNLYAHYAIAKAFRSLLPQPVQKLSTGKDWFLDPTDGLARTTINRQRSDGSWVSSAYVSPPTSTAWSIIMLTPSLFQRGPVAVIHARPNPTAVGYPVVFDARGSYHQHPAYKVTEYRWDFNASNGLDFDHPDGYGPVVTNYFSSKTNYTVTLQVRDNATPQLNDTASVAIDATLPPYPPTADAGGPYIVGVGEDVHLDGSGSFDVDMAQGDYITAYDWETDFQMPLDFNDGVTGRVATIERGYPSNGTYRVGLRVSDATAIVFPSLGLTNLTSDDFAYVYAYDRVITNLFGRAKDHKIQLIWSKAGDYAVIQRSTLGPDRGFEQIAQTDSSYATFLDTNVAFNVGYFYRILAYRNGQAAAFGISDPEYVLSHPRTFDPNAPYFTVSPPHEAQVGRPYEFNLTAAAPDGAPLTFNLLTGPTNMTLNASNGLVVFQPSMAQLGSLPVCFEVTNTSGRDELCYTLVVFTPSNHPPAVQANGPYAALTGQSLQFSSAGTTDPEGDPISYTWVFGDGTTATNANPTHMYPAQGNYLVTLFANDGHGGTASATTQARISRPNRAPVANAGHDQVVYMTQTVQLDGSGSYDFDPDTLQYQWSFITRPSGSTATLANATAVHPTFVVDRQGTYVAQLIVNDGLTNSLPDAVVFTTANSLPVAKAGPDQRASVSDIVQLDGSASYDVDGNALSYQWSFFKKPQGSTAALTNAATARPTFAVDAPGTYILTLVVNDVIADGAADLVVVSTGNLPPLFTSSPPTNAVPGVAWRYQAQATDPDPDLITFDLTLNTAGMTLDSITGVAVWVPQQTNMGVNSFTLRAQDGNGGEAFQSFQILVRPPNQTPVITSHPTGPAVVNVAYRYQVQATDADGDPITFSTNSAPSGMRMDSATGLLTWTPTVSQLGTQHVAVAASDPWGAAAIQMFDLPVLATAPNHSPAITSVPRGSVRARMLYTYPAQATDPDGDPLSFTLTNFPAGMAISSAGLVSWTPTLGQAGTNRVALRVDDGRGGYVVQAWNIVVLSPDTNLPPGIISEPPTIAVVGRAYAYDPVADDLEGDVLKWSLDAQPTGLTINTNSGAIRWTPVVGQLGTNAVTVRVTDSGSNAAWQSFVVTVRSENLPPQITSTPATNAHSDEVYAYAVTATDPENDPLAITLTRSPTNMVLNATNGLIEWQPLASQVGSNAVTIQVSDGVGGVATQSFAIYVSTNLNHSPVIISTPAQLAGANLPYQYQITASDADNDPLTFMLLTAPAGMTVNANSGLVLWTPSLVQTGQHQVVVGVVDPHGAGGSQSYPLVVVPDLNHPPVLGARVQTTTFAGLPYTFDVQASDPDGDPVTVTLQGPPGMVMDAAWRVAWLPGVTNVGTNFVRLTATDNHGASNSFSFNLTVVTDTTPPSLHFACPPNPLPIGSILDITAYATDNSGGRVSLEVRVDNADVPLDASGCASVTLNRAGSIPVWVKATDPSGNRTTNTCSISVFATGGDSFPVVEITSPTDGTTLTSATNILGTAAHTNLLYYTLEVKPLSGDTFTEIGRGSNSVVEGVLGLLDPTTLANDTYILRLTAMTITGNSLSKEVEVSVAGEVKLGNFRLSFTDLSIPVNGVPIVVGRTYDSLDANNKGDFGYGWRMEFRDVRLRTSVPRPEYIEDSFGETALYYYPFTSRTRVYVTLPGGKREGFTFKPQRKSGFGGYLAFYDPAFEPDPGVNSSLGVLQSSGVTLTQDEYGEFRSLNELPYNPEDAANFGGAYYLTTKEGLAYEVDAHTGNMQQVVDPNNNTLTFATNAIVSSTGVRVTFTRDPQGRITSVTDLQGKVIRYQYNAQGDLASVTDRQTNITRFVYSSTRPHYLQEIIDPLGRTGVRTEYDAQGRLVRLTDAAGNPVNLIHNTDQDIEQVVDALGHTNTFVYDERGNVIQEVNALSANTLRAYNGGNYMTMEVDPLLNTNRFEYDGQGNVTRRIDPLGNETVSTYQSFSAGGLIARVQGALPFTRLKTTTDPLGNTTTNDYDGGGNVIATTDSAGNTTRYTYDGAGNQTSVTDAAGNVTRFEYDTSGHLLRQTDAASNSTAYTYDLNGNQISQTTVVTIRPGVLRTNTTFTGYDANGRPTSNTDAAGNTTRTEYDALGKTKATIDALGHRTEFYYDERGQLTNTLFADGTRTSLTYDVAGRRTTSTDRAGRTTYYEYDAVGRLVSTIYPDDTPGDLSDNPRTRTFYDLTGRVAVQTDERTNSTWFGYDAAGRQVAVTNALGWVTTSAYDAAGRKIADTDALGRTVQYSYDTLGRRHQTTFADGTTKRTLYDALGRVTAEVDQAGVTNRFEYDSLGRLTKVVDALGQSTSYAYNESGKLVRQQDALGHVTRYEFETCCQRSATILPLGQRSTTIFNAVNNVAFATNFNGQVIAYDYDVNNRLAVKTLPGGVSVRYGYTPTGRRAAITNSASVTTWTYDARDRLLSRTDPDGRGLEYSYDQAGNRTAIATFTDHASRLTNHVWSFTFDALNRLETVADAGGTNRYAYDPANNLAIVQLANGTSRTNFYDALNRVTNIFHAGPAGFFASFRYTLAPTGNRRSVQDLTGRTVAWDYDALSRLTRETVTSDPAGQNYAASYVYDAVGNRLYFTNSLEGVTAYQYDDNDQLLSEFSSGIGYPVSGIRTDYSYDSNGNTLSRSNANESAVYAWTAENRLRAATVTTNGVSRQLAYAYDDDGIRMAASMTEAGITAATAYLVDANRPFAQVLEEWTSLNAQPSTLNASYTYGHQLLSQNRAGVRSYYHADHLGSTRALTDQAGSQTDGYAFDGYGRTLRRSGPTENAYLFTGEQRDLATGLDYLRARYFIPSSGRFYAMDPLPGTLSEPSTLHRFHYTQMDPVNSTDPTGEFTLTEAALTIAILGIVSGIAWSIRAIQRHFGPFFPLAAQPSSDWTSQPRAFGSPRGTTRAHAGADLYAPVGTWIYAIQDGTVLQGPYQFYCGTFALEIDHGTFIARYGEVQQQTLVQAGGKVKGGDKIAKVGHLNCYSATMLHLELYGKTATGQLNANPPDSATRSDGVPFYRRKDLIDPTSMLNRWQAHLPKP